MMFLGEIAEHVRSFVLDEKYLAIRIVCAIMSFQLLLRHAAQCWGLRRLYWARAPAPQPTLAPWC
jgi:hypothetical protein